MKVPPIGLKSTRINAAQKLFYFDNISKYEKLLFIIFFACRKIEQQKIDSSFPNQCGPQKIILCFKIEVPRAISTKKYKKISDDTEKLENRKN